MLLADVGLEKKCCTYQKRSPPLIGFYDLANTKLDSLYSGTCLLLSNLDLILFLELWVVVTRSKLELFPHGIHTVFG